MYLLGFDIGSSSVKAALINADNGQSVASATSPKTEMPMLAKQPGWAEQEPEMWWDNLKLALAEVLHKANAKADEILAIGISYQMHGLVTVDKSGKILRPAIIWCDSRAVPYGDQAFKDLGEKKCLSNFLNSPGNFTASKLKWVKENEPALFEKIDKILLPGDYIAYKLTGALHSTISGISEGILWNFKKERVATELLKYYGISETVLPPLVPTFSVHAGISAATARELGLKEGTPISYRAGDQPNNAFSLNVLNKGEVAATAGTSGVVYGITDEPVYDKKSRVNAFVHVSHQQKDPRYGVLLCVNGTGIQNSWLKNTLFESRHLYDEMNLLASGAPIGSDGVKIYPFGNGAERLLGNKTPGGSVHGLQFNRHTNAHIARAAQEGIAFGLNYGMDIMRKMGIDTQVVRAGEANMFLSPVFREAFCNVTGAVVELYNTDGAQGAARGAGIGSGHYKSFKEAFLGLKKCAVVEPEKEKQKTYSAIYGDWLEGLQF